MWISLKRWTRWKEVPRDPMLKVKKKKKKKKMEETMTTMMLVND